MRAGMVQGKPLGSRLPLARLAPLEKGSKECTAEGCLDRFSNEENPSIEAGTQADRGAPKKNN